MKKPIAIGLLHLAMASASWSLTPADIFENVEAKYLSLDSIAFDSTVVLNIENTVGRNKEGKHTSTTTCKVCLARPSFYRIEWKRPLSEKTALEGAAWSSGVRHYVRFAEKVTQLDNIELAFAGLTGKTLANLFFQRPSSVLRSMNNAILEPDEKVGGFDCYVVSGVTSAGGKVTLWVTKEFLVVQVRETLGNNPDLREEAAAAVEKTLARHEQSSPPDVAAHLKQMRENTRESMRQMKSSTTETIESIELNPSFEKEIFENEERKLSNLPR